MHQAPEKVHIHDVEASALLVRSFQKRYRLLFLNEIALVGAVIFFKNSLLGSTAFALPVVSKSELKTFLSYILTINES